MIDNSIQKTIAICYEYLPDEFLTKKGKVSMKQIVKYAQAVYLGPHRNLIRLFEKYIKIEEEKKKKEMRLLS